MPFASTVRTVMEKLSVGRAQAGMRVCGECKKEYKLNKGGIKKHRKECREKQKLEQDRLARRQKRELGMSRFLGMEMSFI